MLEKKREQKIDIQITEKLMNKMEAKLEKKLRIFHKKWTGLTQNSYKKHVRGDHCEECE